VASLLLRSTPEPGESGQSEPGPAACFGEAGMLRKDDICFFAPTKFQKSGRKSVEFLSYSRNNSHPAGRIAKCAQIRCAKATEASEAADSI
jgi:hypothetical protein